ncbi:hypothetical protein GH714_031598 [Hevea brasiliensis]|uniref:Uncharacterized protein n=1 Tax=Hevea brasiliensis TaxID=3981 RepID=A0A6A6N9J4_HEVBR|nr:hypothetical protein GH714_031598 [Hevea brasiliensis]
MEKAPASKPFVQQNIFKPRYIKWDSFSDLPYEFEDLFNFQGWMEFSELNEYYYPYLIQEFYGSLKEVVKGESFSVKVKKKSQIVDVDFFASVLNLPNDGNRIGTFKDTRKLEGYDEKAFQLSIFPEVCKIQVEAANTSKQTLVLLKLRGRRRSTIHVLDKLANQVDATIYEDLSSKPSSLDEASIIHERILRANTKDYGTYDPAPALVKPPFKLIPN